MKIPAYFRTDLDRIDYVLGARGRRKEVIVNANGAMVLDKGPRRGIRAGLTNLLDSNPTTFRFSPSGRLVGVTRSIKALWLLRGTSLMLPR